MYDQRMKMTEGYLWNSLVGLAVYLLSNGIAIQCIGQMVTLRTLGTSEPVCVLLEVVLISSKDSTTSRNYEGLA